RSVRGDKAKTVGAGLLVDEIIDIALPVDRDLLGAVARDWHIAHQLEQRVQLRRVGMSVFEELEAGGAHRIVGADGGGRGVVRKWSHLESPHSVKGSFRHRGRKVHANEAA